MLGADATITYGLFVFAARILQQSFITPEPTPITASHSVSKCIIRLPVACSSGFITASAKVNEVYAMPAPSSTDSTSRPAASSVFLSVTTNGFDAPSIFKLSGSFFTAPAPVITSRTEQTCVLPQRHPTRFISSNTLFLQKNIFAVAVGFLPYQAVGFCA